MRVPTGGSPRRWRGRSVVVTGTVSCPATREEAEAAIVAAERKSPGSVSKSTFAVVVGEDPRGQRS